jgi:hypothetical protein
LAFFGVLGVLWRFHSEDAGMAIHMQDAAERPIAEKPAKLDSVRRDLPRSIQLSAGMRFTTADLLGEVSVDAALN